MSDDEVYNQLLRFSVHLHSKSANSVQNFIDSNLHQIDKVWYIISLNKIHLPPPSQTRKIQMKFYTNQEKMSV